MIQFLTNIESENLLDKVMNLWIFTIWLTSSGCQPHMSSIWPWSGAPKVHLYNTFLGGLHQYYQELLMIFSKELKSSDVWNTLQDHWILYQKKHYARDDNQVEEFRESEEECNASDEDDWQIEMPDGDKIDDIEEACVNEDSPPPRNRQRLSC